MAFAGHTITIPSANHLPYRNNLTYFIQKYFHHPAIYYPILKVRENYFRCPVNFSRIVDGIHCLTLILTTQGGGGTNALCPNFVNPPPYGHYANMTKVQHIV